MEKKHTRRVFVCSPYRGKTPEETQENIQAARKAVRFIAQRGDAPYAPHLYLPQTLRETIIGMLLGQADDDPVEREMGIKAGLAFLEKCDELVVFAYKGITEGMQRELAHANICNIPVTVIWTRL